MIVTKKKIRKYYNKKELEEYVYFYLKKVGVITPPVLTKLGLHRASSQEFLNQLAEQGKIRKVLKVFLPNKKDEND